MIQNLDVKLYYNIEETVLHFWGQLAFFEIVLFSIVLSFLPTAM
jgi:hypothetical protein